MKQTLHFTSSKEEAESIYNLILEKFNLTTFINWYDDGIVFNEEEDPKRFWYEITKYPVSSIYEKFIE